MLVSMVVVSLVSSSALALYSQFASRYGVETEISTLTAAGERAMQQVLKDVRLAGYPAKGMYGLNAASNLYDGSADNVVSQGFIYNTAPSTPAVTATPTALTFEAGLGVHGSSTLGVPDPIVSVVSYSLNGVAPDMTLVRTTTNKLPTGAPDSATSANVVDHVSSLQFSYFDASGNALSPVTISNASLISQVKILLVLQTYRKDLRSGIPAVLTFSGGTYVRR
jgi:hypothetical protein